MLKWSVIFLIIALVAGIFGFFGIVEAAASIAKVLFFIFVVLFVISSLQDEAECDELLLSESKQTGYIRKPMKPPGVGFCAFIYRYSYLIFYIYVLHSPALFRITRRRVRKNRT